MTSCWKGTDCSQERAILLLQSKFHKIRLVNFMPLYESRLSVSIASFIVIICLFATESLMSRCSLERIMRSDQLEPAESFGNRRGFVTNGQVSRMFWRWVEISALRYYNIQWLCPRNVSTICGANITRNLMTLRMRWFLSYDMIQTKLVNSATLISW